MALPSNYKTPSVPPSLFGRRPSVSGTGSGHHKNQNYNPFIQSANGHPSFAAARFARLAESQDSGSKPIKAPKPPMLPYMRYSKKMWDHVKAANPRVKAIPDLTKMIGKMWQDLTAEERKIYEVEYEMEKIAYQEAMQNYHNSSAYQEWFKKEEMRKIQLAQEAEEKKHMGARVGVVQADEDEDNIFSLKHLASARYSRNHLLMADIFSSAVVPESHVHFDFAKKLHRLREQRQTMESTLNTKQSNLKVLDEKHDKIRKLIQEDRDKWEKSWVEVCSKKPKISDEDFEEMVQKALKELKEKQQQQQVQQQKKEQLERENKVKDPHNDSVSEPNLDPSRVEAVSVEHRPSSAIGADGEASKQSLEIEALVNNNNNNSSNDNNNQIATSNATTTAPTTTVTTQSPAEPPQQEQSEPQATAAVNGVEAEEMEEDEEDMDDDEEEMENEEPSSGPVAQNETSVPQPQEEVNNDS